MGPASRSIALFPAASLRQLPQALTLCFSRLYRLVEQGELVLPFLEVAAHWINSTLHVGDSFQRDGLALLVHASRVDSTWLIQGRCETKAIASLFLIPLGRQILTAHAYEDARHPDNLGVQHWQLVDAHPSLEQCLHVGQGGYPSQVQLGLEERVDLRVVTALGQAVIYGEKIFSGASGTCRAIRRHWPETFLKWRLGLGLDIPNGRAMARSPTLSCRVADP